MIVDVLFGCSHLTHDKDLKHLLPIDNDGRELYDKVKDGILLWYVLIQT